LKSDLYREIRRYLTVIFALLAIGYFSGYMLACVAVGLLLIVIWQLGNANRIFVWLQKKSDAETPALSGIWSDLVKQILKIKKRLKLSQNSRQNILNRVEDITSSLPNGVVLLTKDLNLDWWNRPAEKFLSLKSSQRGQHIIDLVPSMAFGEFILTGDFSNSVEIIHPENKYLALNFSVTPFGDDETILIIQDVSQLRHLEQIRQDFVDNISHELRTPLTVISGYIENLQYMSETLPPSVQKALLQMEQQTNRMTDLTNDLLMLSRLESLSENAEYIPIALSPLLAEIEVAANELSNGKQKIEVSYDDSIFLLGDRLQLSSAISNLVFNAVRHTPQGSHIEIVAKSADNGLHIIIKDNGNGIDSKHLPRLTERFYRVSGSRNSDTGGTGLGLAIVKHILMRHEGHLSIRSQLGQGSVFYCELPKPRFQLINPKTLRIL